MCIFEGCQQQHHRCKEADKLDIHINPAKQTATGKEEGVVAQCVKEHHKIAQWVGKYKFKLFGRVGIAHCAGNFAIV